MIVNYCSSGHDRCDHGLMRGMMKKITRGLLLVAALFLAREFGLLDKLPEVARPSYWLEGEYTPVGETPDGWDLLTGVSLVPTKSNDGDSFKVKHGNQTTIFRLYYVDTPESELKKYRDGNTNRERVAEQADYFGGLALTQATALGEAAKKFTLDLLNQGGFEVLTKYEGVYGPGRRYAFILVPWEGKRVFLHELLVDQGLARIHTKGTTLPNGRHTKDQKEQLQRREKKAQESARGGWGMARVAQL